jgi:hypothetical protein
MLVEHALVAYNHGAPNLTEVTSEFIAAGYAPWCLDETHFHNHILVQVDIFWVHRRVLEAFTPFGANFMRDRSLEILKDPQ